MKVLIVGATGMLGYSLFRTLGESSSTNFEVYGTVRSIEGKERYFNGCLDRVIQGIDISDLSGLDKVMAELKPEILINCIGLIKQKSISKEYLDAIAINSLLPHQLASICDNYSAKLIHFSTDCIFDGVNGGYAESDAGNAQDLYGRTKLLGEVSCSPHLTLRTSIIGHELSSNNSLIDWFLSQQSEVKGYSKAIFSGIPTCIIARILKEYIFSKPQLSGLYHLSAQAINKYDLLCLVAKVYGKDLIIKESEELVIDRSLNSSLLRGELDFDLPPWEHLISEMYENYKRVYSV
jgi:dTDP-4-dehydrorhamnose reductase